MPRRPFNLTHPDPHVIRTGSMVRLSLPDRLNPPPERAAALPIQSTQRYLNVMDA
jgi:hypothetical protein